MVIKKKGSCLNKVILLQDFIYLKKLTILISLLPYVDYIDLQMMANYIFERQTIILSIALHNFLKFFKAIMSKLNDFVKTKQSNLLSSFDKAQLPMIHFNQQLKYASIVYQKQIFCQFHRTTHLLSQLLHVLEICPYFDGSATLESNIPQPSISKQQPPTLPSLFVSNNKATSEYKISYSLIVDMEEQLQEQCLSIRVNFQNSCDAIHLILQKILDSYNLENRVAYWTTKFQKELLKCYSLEQRLKLKEHISDI